MTPEEIVKALRVCGESRFCKECPSNELKDTMGVYPCADLLMMKAADLIEQQAAKIKELEAKVPNGGGNGMKKLFISQPMQGKTDEEILAVRIAAAEATQRLLGEEVQVIDSFIKGAPEEARPLWYLGESLKLLSCADVVYFAAGWESARGCRIEYDCAIAYEIPTIADGGVI